MVQLRDLPGGDTVKRLTALLLACLLLLSGCAGEGDSTAAAFAPAEENRLVVYTSHKEEVYWPIIKEFEERTGIWVDVVSGGTNELLERIEREQDSPRADVMFGGGVESLESRRDLFAPYRCADTEELLEQYRSPDDLWTPFSALPVVLIYNTKLVDAGAVTGWRDLLSPEFRGKIAFADPAISGSSFTGLATLAQALGGSWEETLQALAYNLDGIQLDSSGAVLTAVAGGTALVGVTLEETAMQRIAAGDSIALVYPAEGTSAVPDGGALVKGAPHADNARRFLDFTACADVQRLLVDRFYRRSVRSDVAAAPALIPLADIPMAGYDVAWASGLHDAMLMAWAFHLGGEEGDA